jgi:hypothetical protein
VSCEIFEPPRGARLPNHPMPDDADRAWVATVAVPSDRMPGLVRALINVCGFDSAGQEPSQDGYATAEYRRQVKGVKPHTIEYRVLFTWRPDGRGGSMLAWKSTVRQHASRLAAVKDEVDGPIARSLRTVVTTWQQQNPPSPELPHDPVVGPGQKPPLEWRGVRRDYSRAADWEQIRGLASDGVLPLGRYLRFPENAQGWPLSVEDADGAQGPELFLPAASETRSAIICAPSGSGKTELMLRWAQAAMLARRSVLILDVKGNVYDNLQRRLVKTPAENRPVLHRFSTNASGTTTQRVRMNFLAEIEYGTNKGRTQIAQLAQAIVPDTGFTGQDRTFYDNRLKWCAAFIGITCLHSTYIDHDSRRHPRPATRRHDMADVRDLLRDQWLFCVTVCRIRALEMHNRDVGAPITTPNVTDWFLDVATLVSPTMLNDAWTSVRETKPAWELQEKCPLRGGQGKMTYEELTTSLSTALQVFDPNNALHPSVSGEDVEPGMGSQLKISDLFGAKPMALVIEAQGNDPSQQDTVLSMVLALVNAHLAVQFTAVADRPNALMLLDETQRIRGFKGLGFVTFARQAGVGAVLVYQTVEQIRDDEDKSKSGARSLLDAVGTIVFLRDMRGEGYEIFGKMLGTGQRGIKTAGVTQDIGGLSNTEQFSMEAVPRFESEALAPFPFGPYSALILVRDHPSGLPFFTDMTDRAADLTCDLTQESLDPRSQP